MNFKDKKNADLDNLKITLTKSQQSNNVEQQKAVKKNVSISKTDVREKKVKEKKIDILETSVNGVAKNNTKSNVKDVQNIISDLKEDDNKKENNENLPNKSEPQSKNKDVVKDNIESNAIKKKDQIQVLKSPQADLKALFNITKDVTNNNTMNFKIKQQNQKNNNVGINDFSEQKVQDTRTLLSQNINLVNTKASLSPTRIQVLFLI